MSDHIPFDIQMKIIKKVSDVRSLIRFRSVSKLWKSSIDSSEFKAAYGFRHTQPHRLLLRYRDTYMAAEKYVCFVDENDTLARQRQNFAPNVPLLIKQLKYSEVIGSSCGLWCLHGILNNSEKEVAVIWNPAIRKSVGIVMPCVLNDTSEKTTHFGFGVCPSTYDPTIVIMSDSTDKWQVEVFTLSSKTWKMIPSSNLPRESIRLRSSTQVAIDRFIYWFAYDGVPQTKKLILSFDLITHEFKHVNLPDSIANQFSGYFSISKLSESLVVSENECNEEVNEIAYGVWMMGEEGGVMPSFTKLFNINTPDELWINKILGFTMSGEPIMETENEKDDGEFTTVKVYKPCSKHINGLGINGQIDSFFICPYTETLLLVDHSDCCIISGDS